MWPLIDKGLSRRNCIDKLAGFQWSAPRSACKFCPYKSNDEWRFLRDEAPEEWAETVALSYDLAARGEFIHRSLKPLDQVDLSTWAERGQPDLFGNECEGMCGV
jgi:hypothetical protein